jgi:hypothetical protein
MRIFPIDRKRLVHLKVLAGFDAATAENALLWVVAIERVCVIFFVRLGSIGDALMFNC